MTASSMPDSNSSNSGQPAAEPVTFDQLGVPEPLVRVLRKDGKTSAFPIQRDTLPDALAGRDILGRGRTGSGKTLAFSIPLVARLAADQEGRATHGRGGAAGSGSLPRPRGLVLAPTRELANQIDEVLNPLAQAYGMRTCTVYGGVGQGRQVDALRRGAKIVVACPGRLEDLLRQHKLSLEDVEIAVLDEADEMADMGFLPAVERILAQVRPGGQRMLFSATLDHGVDAVVKRFLKDPKIHEVDSATQHVDLMTHHIFRTTQAAKHDLVRKLASGTGRRILFTRTKFQAKKLAKNLIDNGIPAAQLHGNLSQNQRDRNLGAFSRGEVKVLVATDVAARGVDISDVDLVVQVDPPADPKSFLHRSGRTARAGRSGDVVTLVLPDQWRDTRRMLRMAHIDAKPVQVTADSPEVTELVGPVAKPIRGWSLQTEQPQASGERPARSRRGGRSGYRGRSQTDRRFGRGGQERHKGRGRGRQASWSQRPSEDRSVFDREVGPLDGRTRSRRHAGSSDHTDECDHGHGRNRAGSRLDTDRRDLRRGRRRHRRDNNPFRYASSR
ncbi:DEAD/DEAH box helicase [Bifidobacterium sp. W8101]|nr:DEAD/DEAH box helicase [Bifidobacterium choladohabitans]MBI0127655.1 DEAD/DEAH box helicase [Bifidobacterium sp. W8103]MBI0138243.1 DEAD/DEAH box helicase [Bifidobacterium sp. W8105]MBI0148787.1 DEAD/DEAH box helicase [Bifidobacterium sp. W8107]